VSRTKFLFATFAAGLCVALMVLGTQRSSLTPLTAAEAEQVVGGQTSSDCQKATLNQTFGCQKKDDNGKYLCPAQPEQADFADTGPSKPFNGNCFYNDSNNMQQDCGAFKISVMCATTGTSD
jgi:hypothetical protein